MKNKIRTNLWWVTFVLTLVLLIAHSFSIRTIMVDNTSVVLLVLLLFAPFASDLRRLKIGDIEAEINTVEIEQLERHVQNQTADAPVVIPVFHELQKPASTTEDIWRISNGDPLLALAELHNQLEKKIHMLHRISYGNEKAQYPYPAAKRLLDLTKEGVLTEGLSAAVTKTLALSQRAIHGEKIEEAGILKLIELGTALLNHLQGGASLVPKL